MALQTFREVLHFIKKPTALFHPGLVFRVLKLSLGVEASKHNGASFDF